MLQYLKKITFLIFIFYSPLLFSQLTIKVNSTPDNTLQEEAIYLVGNFNDWNPSDPDYQLTDNEDGSYQISFSTTIDTLEFKFSRGNWISIEADLQGYDIENRTLIYNETQQEVDVIILSWKDRVNADDTDFENVFILDEAFYMPQLDRSRRIWIYLPPDYIMSNNSYSVMYMHDGQQLFDPEGSFGGEWEIDETLNNLFAKGDKGIIVVGIDNGGTNLRIDEYHAWGDANYGGEGKKYTNFIINTLKPYVDHHFRTKPDRLHTGIMGSSFGAVISIYAATEHPDVFSKVGLFSPAFWFTRESYFHVERTGKKADMRFYIIAGGEEDQDIRYGAQKIYGILKSVGFEDSELHITIHRDGDHNEKFWRREFPAAYQWLFDNTVVAVEDVVSKNNVRIFPNPFSELINCSLTHGIKNVNLNIYNTIGALVYSKPLANDGQVNLAYLTNGFYFFQLSQNGNILLSRKLLRLE